MRSGPRTRHARAPALRRTERHGEGPGPVPVPMPVAFAAGERETLGRTRTQRKPSRARRGFAGKTHVAIMGAPPHGQATGARTGPARRRGTVGAHLPRRRSSKHLAIGSRSDGSCGILGRARVVWRVLLSAGQPLVLPSKLPPNQTTGLASGSSIC